MSLSSRSNLFNGNELRDDMFSYMISHERKLIKKRFLQRRGPWAVTQVAHHLDRPWVADAQRQFLVNDREERHYSCQPCESRGEYRRIPCQNLPGPKEIDFEVF